MAEEGQVLTGVRTGTAVDGSIGPGDAAADGRIFFVGLWLIYRFPAILLMSN